jgi:hypothetical protein
MGEVKRGSMVPIFCSSDHWRMVIAGIRNKNIHGRKEKYMRIDAKLSKKNPLKNSHEEKQRNTVINMYAKGELKYALSSLCIMVLICFTFMNLSKIMNWIL